MLNWACTKVLAAAISSALNCLIDFVNPKHKMPIVVKATPAFHTINIYGRSSIVLIGIVFPLQNWSANIYKTAEILTHTRLHKYRMCECDT